MTMMKSKPSSLHSTPKFIANNNKYVMRKALHSTKIFHDYFM